MADQLIPESSAQVVAPNDAPEPYPTRDMQSSDRRVPDAAPQGASGGSATKVALATASPALLRGLETLLLAMPGVELVGTAPTISALLAAVSSISCDIVIVDLSLVRDLVDALLTRMQAAAPRARVLLITDTFQPFVMREALKLGASGFIAKTSEADEILAAVRSAASGRTYVALAFASRLSESLTFDELTQREMQVLDSLSRGGCNKSIARDLDVSIGTVKTHVRAIMGKLDSRSRTDVALKAIRFGLIVLDQ